MPYQKNELTWKEVLEQIASGVVIDSITIEKAPASFRFSDLRPKIKKVIFNPPATIILWADGTKTVVKASGEKYDKEKGVAMAIVKKLTGNLGRYNEIIKYAVALGDLNSAKVSSTDKEETDESFF